MAVASSLNLNGVSRGVNSLQRGLGNVGKSVDNIRKILINRTTVKRQAFASRQMLQSRRSENVRRRDQEDILEASGIKPTLRRTRNAIVENTKGFLGRIMDFIGTLFVGWLLFNLPTIIVWTKDLIKRIQTLFGVLTGFIENLIYVFGDIGRIFTGILDDIVHFDFLDTRKKVQSAFDDLNMHFEDMGKQFEDGVKSVTTPLGQGAGEQQAPPGQIPFGQPAPAPSGGTTVGGIHKQALNIISKYESATAGDYNAMNQGTVADSAGNRPRAGSSIGIIRKNLTDMTIGEVIAHQDHRLNNNQGFIHAAGRYQIIGNTLPEAMRGAGLSPNDMFSPENQDKMGLYLLRTGGIGKWEGPKANATPQERAIIAQAQRTPVSYTTPTAALTTQPSAPLSGNIISVGKSILSSGFTVAENKYFTKNNWSAPGPNMGIGFNPAGNSYVGRHASSDHATNALDVTDWRGSEASGVPRLKNLFLSLYSNRSSLGIKALIYDPIGYWFTGMKNYVGQAYGGHGNHLHVGFTKSADTALKSDRDLGIIALNQGQGQNVPSAITPERRGQTIAVVDNRQPSSPTPTPSASNAGAMMLSIPSSNGLNSFIKQNLLLDLAYT